MTIHMWIQIFIAASRVSDPSFDLFPLFLFIVSLLAQNLRQARDEQIPRVKRILRPMVRHLFKSGSLILSVGLEEEFTAISARCVLILVRAVRTKSLLVGEFLRIGSW